MTKLDEFLKRSGSSEVIGKNFLFAKHLIMEAAGVSQHVAYAVNPTIRPVVRAIYFSDIGEMNFYTPSLDKESRVLDIIYRGPSTPDFLTALADDVYPSEDQPGQQVSICLVEEYGIAKSTKTESKPVSIDVEVHAVTPVVSCKYLESKPAADGSAAAAYQVTFKDGYQVVAKVETAGGEDLTKVSHTANEIVVDGFAIPINQIDFFRFIRLYKQASFNLDVLAGR